MPMFTLFKIALFFRKIILYLFQTFKLGDDSGKNIVSSRRLKQPLMHINRINKLPANHTEADGNMNAAITLAGLELCTKKKKKSACSNN
jgi:hypothetical protein